MKAGVYDLLYSIQVLDPNRLITYASLGVDTAGLLGETVTKTFYDKNLNLLGSITSVDGVPAGMSLSTQYLIVAEHIVVTGVGDVYQTTDTYTQTLVPEPATVIIWSLLGGLGLVFAWRKRKSA